MARPTNKNKHIASSAQIALVDALLNNERSESRFNAIVSDGSGYSVVASGCWSLTRELNNGQEEHILRLFQDTGVNVPPSPGNMAHHSMQATMHLHVNWHQLHQAVVTKSDEGNIKVVFHNEAGAPVLSAFKLRDAGVKDDVEWNRLLIKLQALAAKPFQHSDSVFQGSLTQRGFFGNLFTEFPNSKVLFTGQSDRLTQITSPRILADWEVVREINGSRLEDCIRIQGAGQAAEQNSDRQFLRGMPQHQRLHSTHAHVRWADLGKATVTVGGPNGNEAILAFNKGRGAKGPKGPALVIYATKGMEKAELAALRAAAKAYNRYR